MAKLVQPFADIIATTKYYEYRTKYYELSNHISVTYVTSARDTHFTCLHLLNHWTDFDGENTKLTGFNCRFQPITI